MMALQIRYDAVKAEKMFNLDGLIAIVAPGRALRQASLQQAREKKEGQRRSRRPSIDEILAGF